MSSFTTPLVVSPTLDGRRWKLVEPFVYDVGYEGSNNTIMVPAGFVTDFASSPPQIWSIIPPWGKYGKAAIIHDFLYQTHAERKKQPLGELVFTTHNLSRKRCDEIFKEGMGVLGVAPWRISLMFWGVRVFGWLAWH